MTTKTELHILLKDFFLLHSADYPLDLVFLYGSWSRGLPKSDSDVDLAVVFEDYQLSESIAFQRVTDLSVRLTSLLHREVNIIAMDMDFRHPMLYYNAVVCGELLYAKNENHYLTWHNQAIVQMEDFQLFGSGWQKEAAKKQLGMTYRE